MDVHGGMTAFVMSWSLGHEVFLGGFGESDVCAFELLQSRGDKSDSYRDLGLMYVWGVNCLVFNMGHAQGTDPQLLSIHSTYGNPRLLDGFTERFHANI